MSASARKFRSDSARSVAARISSASLWLSAPDQMQQIVSHSLSGVTVTGKAETPKERQNAGIFGS
jgi:hypothetical protein